ncbi:hypothetical protein OH77DRAFT_1524770 [Trametes cingulata]|nr:hypothetical protein OH77DRAFT_1524770 [Trametes cingulata]
MSLPLFTPEQVLRALHEILPLALSEHRFSETLWLLTMSPKNTPGPSLLETLFGPLLFAEQANGMPLFMSTPMLVHSSFSCGTLSPEQAWSNRPLTSYPLQRRLHPPRGHGTWSFVFDWDHARHRYHDGSANSYAFVYYEQVLCGKSILDCDCFGLRMMSENEKEAFNATIPPELKDFKGCGPTVESLLRHPRSDVSHYVGEVHDLRGFLRCMVDEGRPLPPVDLVAALERLLDSRDAVTMEKICGVMAEDRLPHSTYLQKGEEILNIFRPHGNPRETETPRAGRRARTTGGTPVLLFNKRDSACETM